jgi:putative toxin-antitoxin system antitoxin component (TIGR02293 family)
MCQEPRKLSGSLETIYANSAEDNYRSWFAMFQNQTTTKRMTSVREGLPAMLFDMAAKDLGISQAEMLCFAGVSSSTFHRKLEKNERLDQSPTERLMRLADIQNTCQQIFGNHEQAAQWLKTPNISLGGASPLGVLDNEFGAQAVRKVLSAIEYGGAA